MKKTITKAITFTATATMLIGTIPFTATSVLASENKYPAIATYNEIGETPTSIYDELEAIAPQDSTLQEAQEDVQDLEVGTSEGLSQDTENAPITGTWGTCTWSFDWYSSKALTISGGIGESISYSKPWYRNERDIEKINIEGQITFEENTSLKGLFQDLYNLREITGLENLDTTNVTDISYMFAQCPHLKTLDLSDFNLDNVTNFTDFMDVSYIDAIIVPNNLDSEVSKQIIKYGMSNAHWIDDATGELWDSNPDTLIEGHKYLKCAAGKWGECEWVLHYDSGILTISGGVGESTVDGVAPWHDDNEKINTINIEDKITFEENTSLEGLFKNLYYLKTINGIENLNTTNVTSMKNMFGSNYNLTTVDISKFDTSNVVDMSGMFNSCKSLTILDLSNFDTSNVVDMSYMFGGSYPTNCSNLISLDLSSFDTSNVTDMSTMFYDCYNLKSLDLSNFNTSNVVNMSNMFCGCMSLTTLDLSNFDTSNVKNMFGMFQCSENLTTLDISNFNTSNVTYMRAMFNGCSSLTTLDISNFNTSNVIDMSMMFGQCAHLTILDLSNFNTANVTNMSGMFWLCDNLTKLDISSFDLSKIDVSNSGIYSIFADTVKQVIIPKNFGDNDKAEVINCILACMADVSWTDKTANVKYDGKPDTLIECHRYVVTDSEYDKELTIQASKSENNNTVTFTANGNGGSGDYTYKFIVYNKTTNSWAKLQDFSEKNTFTWTKGNAGDRYFYVDVKDNSTGEVVRSEALNVKLEEATKPLAISATKKEADKTVTFTAEGSGGSGKYIYKFIVYNKTTNSWAKLQDFSSKNTFTWTKGNAGDRYFYVDVKDNSTGKVVRSEALNVKLGNIASKPTSTLTASTANVNVGGKVTLTAKATAGSGKYTYKFLIYNPATNQWAKLQDFSSNSTFTWTAGSAGARQFYVDVKDSNGNVTRSKVVNVGVGNAQPTTKLSVKATASTTANKVGQNVTFTATANGGAGGYKYKFLVYNKTTNQWAKLQDFSATSKLTWKAGSAGERQFYVDVKDKNGNTVRSSVMNVKTTK